MSVNQISQDYHLRWEHQHQQQQQLMPDDSAPNSKSLVFAHHFQNFNLNHPNDDDFNNIDTNSQQQQLETMFEKPLTPSDVGKLNRLVIPKQHAERHFPLNTLNGADSGGMLLCFEDEAGKFWRFRYSYWNSSQSYVLTKGWSRYVKEKRLDAGDVVIFQRHPIDPDRLFIACRRRHDPPAIAGGRSGGSSRGAHQYQPAADPEASAAGVVNGGRTPSFNGSKTLRLFGVNMEYQFESDQSEPATPDGSSTSSPSAQQQQQAAHQHCSHFCPQAYYAMVQRDGSHIQHRG